MAGVPCEELIDFRSPEKKFSMPTCFTPLVPIPLMNISSCSYPLDFANYGSNPFDQLIEQSNINLEAKNDPFEIVCETAFHSNTQEKCYFSPHKFGMKEYDQNNFLNTSVSLARFVKEQVPDICVSAMNLGRQMPANFENNEKSDVDLISSTHRVIDFGSEEMYNDCEGDNMKETSNLHMCFNSSTLSGKLLDLPSPEFENTKNVVKIERQDLCNKIQVSYLGEAKSNFEISKERNYTKNSLNRSFSSAEDVILRQNNCIDADKTVKDIVAERVEKCIQKALNDSRSYSSNSISNLNSSYSASKVKLHRRSYSSSSVRDAEFISWLGLDKSRIKHRKSDFNIDVELSKFNNQCVSDNRNLSFKKTFLPLDRKDSYPVHSSDLQITRAVLSDASPIPGNNTIHRLGSYKSSEASGTDSFSQVKDISDEVFFEANLISSEINRSVSLAGRCMLVEDEDILSIKAPWELSCAQNGSSEDRNDEVGTKGSEETAFQHSTPLPDVKRDYSSRNEKKILPPYVTLTPMARKKQIGQVRLFSHSEDSKKGPLKAILPVIKMTKLQNTKGPIPANTNADKSYQKRNTEPKKTPSPSNLSESARMKRLGTCSQNNSSATDVGPLSVLRRIVSHGNITASTGINKSIQESFHERSRSVDVKVAEMKQTQKDHKAPRRVQSASNVVTAKKEIKKSPFLKPLTRSSKIGAMQMSNSKISPNLQQKGRSKLSTTTVSKCGKENVTL